MKTLLFGPANAGKTTLMRTACLGYAFVKGLRWGYTLGIGVLLVGLLLNVINLTISRTVSPIIVVITIINGVGIYYLMQANGKQHFGK